jgi:hypothetical protein
MRKLKSSKKGGSGLYLNANDKDAFHHFLNNSTSKYFKQGANGVTFKLTLNPTITSNYLSLDASNYSQPVTTMLVKVCFLSPIEQFLEINNNQLRTSQKSDFYEEVNIQTDAYLKTMQYLQPITPAIVYAEILDATNPILNMLNIPDISFVELTTGNLVSVNKDSMKMLTNSGIQIGVIAMEIMKDPVSLHSCTQDKAMYDSYYIKACHSLIEFVMQTGYNHGDFHGANMLLDINVTDYYKNRRGVVKIIDFGYAEKLPRAKYQILKQMYQKKEYVRFLNSLCAIRRKDNYNMHDYDLYLYTCLIKSPLTGTNITNKEKAKLNEQIAGLYEAREIAISELTSSFTAKHLPLGNAEKNKMYSGYIHNKRIVKPKFLFDNQDIFTEDTFKNCLNNALRNNDSISSVRMYVYGLYNFLWIINTITLPVDAVPMEWLNICSIYNVEPLQRKEDFKLMISNNPKNKQIILACSVLDDIHIETILDYVSIPKQKLKSNVNAILIPMMSSSLPYENPAEAATNIKGQMRITERRQVQSQSDLLGELPFDQNEKRIFLNNLSAMVGEIGRTIDKDEKQELIIKMFTESIKNIDFLMSSGEENLKNSMINKCTGFIDDLNVKIELKNVCNVFLNTISQKEIMRARSIPVRATASGFPFQPKFPFQTNIQGGRKSKSRKMCKIQSRKLRKRKYKN